MLIPRATRRRRAISGIIGAVILFTMLFTIGTEYFIFVNNANNLETQSLVNRGNTLSARLEENLVVSAVSSTYSGSLNNILFYVNDTGGQLLNITSAILLSPTGVIEACFGVGLPSGYGCTTSASTAKTVASGDTGSVTFPLAMNVGHGFPKSGYIDTGFAWPKTGTYTLKVFTAQGNIFTGTYPETGVSLAAQALSSGAIGDIYLDVGSYSWYTVAYCSGNNGPYCTTSQGAAFSIPSGSVSCQTCYVAFSVSVKDLNPNQLSIILDANTLIYDIVPSTASNFKGAFWYIMSVSGSTVQSSYSQITLAYDTPTTLYFGSSSSTSFAPNPAGNSFTSGTISLVFILAHGCRGEQTCTTANYNYGQNLPYVSTLYS